MVTPLTGESLQRCTRPVPYYFDSAPARTSSTRRYAGAAQYSEVRTLPNVPRGSVSRLHVRHGAGPPPVPNVPGHKPEYEPVLPERERVEERIEPVEAGVPTQEEEVLPTGLPLD